MICWTAGYGRMTPDQLRALAEGLDVTVVDVRGRPVSRRSGFGRRQLEKLLGERYQWRGNQLGGLHHLANARDHWPAGLRALVAEVSRPLLLCACDAPVHCHRHMLALELARQAPAVTTIHLYHDLETNSWEAIRADEFQRSIVDGDTYECVIWDDLADLRHTIGDAS